MIPCELQSAMGACGALAAGQGRWTELVYTINGGIVVVFFLLVFGAVFWAVLKIACKRFCSSTPKQVSRTQPAAGEDSA